MLTPARSSRGRRLPLVRTFLALAVVVVVAAGAFAVGVVKLPGAAKSAGGNSPAASIGPIQSPPPVDNLATAAKGTLTLADSMAVKSIELGSEGASTTVSATGQPWDGLKIDIPAGAWPGSTLEISARQIAHSTFGKLVTPITPLYSISGAEGMAPSPVTVRIPSNVPADSFAMGFFYDSSSNSLEGMPLVAEDRTSVTAATEHFSSFFVSLVKLALLTPEIDSGFRPGKDDWQFANYGSYVTPNGECAGQILTETWYYLERHLKAGASRLYGLYDNNGGEKTPQRWQDDSNGYRLASVAQTQVQANVNVVAKFFTALRGGHFDALQYDAFRYAIAVTGEPQFVSLSDKQNGSAHAMLAYRVSPAGIFVADPNFPAAWRLIPFDPASGKFGTYFSGSNASAVAEGKGTTYVNFAYKAKTASVDWSTLAADWAAFDDGKIGNGQFPTYDLQVLSGQDAQGQDIWAPLVDGYVTSEKKLTIQMVDPHQIDTLEMQVFRGNSSLLAVPAGDEITLDLTDGDNSLGIAEAAGKPAWNEVDYVDFIHLTVVLGLAPSPSAATVGGHWVLTSSTHDPSLYEGTTIDSTSGHIGIVFADDSGNIQLHEQSSLTWTPPPASAAPGDKWTSTLSAKGGCNDSINTGWAARLYAAAPSSAASIPKIQEWEVDLDCAHTSASKSFSWTFPAHDQSAGTTIAITVGGQDRNGGDRWTYQYNWQP